MQGDLSVVQNQFLEQLRQNHMAQQREAARQQQAAAMDAHRQQDLQQRMLASLSAQQLQQLRSMPRVRLWVAQANLFPTTPSNESVISSCPVAAAL